MTDQWHAQSPLAIARFWASRGWPVFPVRVTPKGDGRKDVMIDGSWERMATTDPAAIDALWGPGRPHEHSAIAIHCERARIVVADGDKGPGKDGELELARLGIQSTLSVRTPGGGVHRYFRALPDREINNSQNKIARGVDIRGVGGFVFAPGSRDFRGQYRIESWPADGEPPPVPQTMTSVLDTKEAEERAKQEEALRTGTPPVVSEQNARRAQAIMQVVARDYGELSDERRGERAWQTCCRLVGLANYDPGNLRPWGELLWQQAVTQSRLNAPGGGLTDREAQRTWARAIGHKRNELELLGEDRWAAEAMPLPGQLVRGDKRLPFAVPAMVEPGQPAEPAPQVIVERPAGWFAEDLGPVLDGTREQIMPTLGHRADRKGLIYPGREHVIAADPESGKTFFCALIVKQILDANGRVTYVDFEDQAETVVGRLLDVGVEPARLREEAGQFRYVQPDSKPIQGQLGALLTFPAGLAHLLIYDGWMAGATLLGYDMNDNRSMEQWRASMTRPVIQLGVATLTTDHLAKAREDGNRNPIGAVAKFSGLSGAMYMLKVEETWGRGMRGKSQVLVSKDRLGGVRMNSVKTNAPNVSHYGDFVCDATGENNAIKTLAIFAPHVESDQPDAEGMPPSRMRRAVEEVSRLLISKNEAFSGREIKSRLEGMVYKDTVDKALYWLEDGGFIQYEGGARRAKLWSWCHTGAVPWVPTVHDNDRSS